MHTRARGKAVVATAAREKRRKLAAHRFLLVVVATLVLRAWRLPIMAG